MVPDFAATPTLILRLPHHDFAATHPDFAGVSNGSRLTQKGPAEGSLVDIQALKVAGSSLPSPTFFVDDNEKGPGQSWNLSKTDRGPYSTTRHVSLILTPYRYAKSLLLSRYTSVRMPFTSSTTSLPVSLSTYTKSAT